MIKFIVKRILEAIPTLLVLITISFFLMRFAPGSPFTSDRPLPPEVLANIEAKYGLDKPVSEQYITYLGNIVQGDFGPSFKYKDFTVNELVSKALPVSAKIGFFAFIFALLHIFLFMCCFCSISGNGVLFLAVFCILSYICSAFAFLCGAGSGRWPGRPKAGPVG